MNRTDQLLKSRAHAADAHRVQALPFSAAWTRHQRQPTALAFLCSGFSATEALINGKPDNLARYLTEHETDLKLPLVADYNGAMINVSIRKLAAAGTVGFYAPVFGEVDYHVAAPIDDYVADFAPSCQKAQHLRFRVIASQLRVCRAGRRSTAPLIGP